MEKNVIVVDELGNEYEATWPRRAKGLVKNGRARFIEENKICLACPPKIKTEDKTMEHEQINAQESAQTANGIPERESNSPITLEYILHQLEKLQSTDYITEALAWVNDDVSGQGRLGIGNLVEAREGTNRRLIAFYEKMYDDLKKSQEQEQTIITTAIQSLADGITPMEASATLENIVEMAVKRLNKTK